MIPFLEKRTSLSPLTADDKKDAVERLLEASSPTFEFYLFLALAIVIVTSGLIIDSPTVVIGGMVVAPILLPIMSLAMGTVMLDPKLIWRSLRTLILAIGLVIGAAGVMTAFFESPAVTGEIHVRADLSAAHIVVALASGTAAAFAFVRPTLSATLPGIAVAVSLLPPLAASGIGIALAEALIAERSLYLFLVNLVGIVAAATAVFAAHGFYGQRKKAEKEMAQEEKELEKAERRWYDALFGR